MAKYISGSAKKGTTTYYFVKDAVTGKLDTDCTRYLKHKVRQNRANNTIKRIAYILPFYMNYLCRLVEKAQEQYLAKNEGTIPISDFL